MGEIDLEVRANEMQIVGLRCFDKTRYSFLWGAAPCLILQSPRVREVGRPGHYHWDFTGRISICILGADGGRGCPCCFDQ